MSICARRWTFESRNFLPVGLLNIRISAGGELAAAESRGFKDDEPSPGDSSTSAQQPAQAGAPSEKGHEEQQPLLPHSSRHEDGAEAADAGEEAGGNGSSEQALREEQAKADAEGGGEGGSAGRAAAEPLSWATRIAQKLYIQVSAAAAAMQGSASAAASCCMTRCWK